MSDPDACPACGGRGIPIVFGMPTFETFEAADRGDVVLGGCTLLVAVPQYRCRECGHEWGASSDGDPSDHRLGPRRR